MMLLMLRDRRAMRIPDFSHYRVHHPFNRRRRCCNSHIIIATAQLAPAQTKIVDLDVSPYNVRVKGDVKMVFYDYDQVRIRRCHCCHIWAMNPDATARARLSMRPACLPDSS